MQHEQEELLPLEDAGELKEAQASLFERLCWFRRQLQGLPAFNETLKPEQHQGSIPPVFEALRVWQEVIKPRLKQTCCFEDVSQHIYGWPEWSNLRSLRRHTPTAIEAKRQLDEKRYAKLTPAEKKQASGQRAERRRQQREAEKTEWLTKNLTRLCEQVETRLSVCEKTMREIKMRWPDAAEATRRYKIVELWVAIRSYEGKNNHRLLGADRLERLCEATGHYEYEAVKRRIEKLGKQIER